MFKSTNNLDEYTVAERFKNVMGRMAFSANVVDNQSLGNYWHTNGAAFLSELTHKIFHPIAIPDMKDALEYIQRYFDLQSILVYQRDGSGQYLLAQCVSVLECYWPPVLSKIPEEEAIRQSGCWLYQSAETQDDSLWINSFSSAWLFPLSEGDLEQGFVVYGSGSSQRMWYGLEFEQLHAATSLIASGMCSAKRIIRSESFEVLGGLFSEISEIIGGTLPLDAQMESILSKSGMHLGAHRGYIFEIDDLVHLHNSIEWVGDKNISYKHLFQHLIFDDAFAGWQKILAQGGYILTYPGQEGDSLFPPVFRNKEDRSLVFPLIVKTQLYGFVGFDLPIENPVGVGDAIFAAVQLLASIIERLIELNLVVHQADQLSSQVELYRNRLNYSEQLVKGIVSATPHGVIVIQNREIVFANPYISDFGARVGVSLVGSRIGDFDHYLRCNQREELDLFYSAIETSGRASIRLHLADGSGNHLVFDIEGSQGPVVDGKMSYVLSCQDVTEALAVQKRVEEANLRYQTILDINPDGVMVFASSSKRLSYINESAQTMLGYSFDELQKNSILSVFAGFSMLKRVCRAIQIINAGEDYRGELELISRSGSRIAVEVKGTSLTLNDLPHYYISMHNITARQLREEKIRISENKYRALIENSHDCMIRMALNGEVLFANSATRKLFNISESAEHILFSNEVLLALLNNLQLVAHTGKVSSFEMEFLSHHQIVILEWSVIPEYGDSSGVETVLFVGRDFSTRRESENALKNAIEKAETADRLKSAFLNNLSHEIRTPLNAVVGFSSFLREDTLSHDDRDLYIDIIQNNADDLMALIDDIVDVAKLESESLPVILAPVSINDLFRKLEKHYAAKIETSKKDLTFTCHYGSSDIVQMQTDQHLLLKAVSKLMDNALKFTAAGFVKCGYEVQNSEILIFVKDSGIGIDDAEQSIIFDSFRQCEKSNGRQFGGTGVGLYIARRVVESLGGTITFHSERNRGSEFFINFPADILLPDKKPEKLIVTESASTVDPVSFKNSLILLAIDDSSERLLIRRYLENTGASIMSVRSVFSALQLLEKRDDIDWLFVDHTALSNNAMRLIESQYKSSNKQGKIVFISADPELTKRDVGVDLIIQKPFDKQQLIGGLLQLV